MITTHRIIDEDGEQMTPVRRLREARGWAQFKLAVESGLSIGTIAAAERWGLMTPRTVRRLAAAFQVSEEELHSRGEEE
ncbi:helix-turn-helix domain-containing protein [Anaeromyxobacter oryzae]|uniref:HTH cro/C1-type domain-containing protein n=1 Tax=Anaeromyxobacter oryzae TaxID=2918170 RepID=A0ABN6MVM3_9BACT|nr:helix-turn-helix transcriptional regulator [Anaeromyxobacter oryzae]BDG04956.1 hypothetical protein AMOR_39520 [Anaeromyxobacter oryzae]